MSRFGEDLDERRGWRDSERMASGPSSVGAGGEAFVLLNEIAEGEVGEERGTCSSFTGVSGSSHVFFIGSKSGVTL